MEINNSGIQDAVYNKPAEIKGKLNIKKPDPLHLKPEDSFTRDSRDNNAYLCTMKNIVGSSIFQKSPVTPLWTFSAESPCILHLLQTKTGKIIGQDQCKVYSIDKETGIKEWEIEKERRDMSYYASGNDGSVYMSCVKQDAIIALDGTTGEKKWESDLKDIVKNARFNDRPDVISSSKNNSVLTSFLFEDRSKEYKPGEDITFKRQFISYDAGTGKVNWKAEFDSNTHCNINMSDDGETCVSDLTGSIVALDMKTGKTLFNYPLKNGIKATWTSVTGPNGDVYFAGSDKKIHAIDRNSGKDKWEYQFSEETGAPVVGADGTVYVESKKGIVAIDGEKGSKKWELPGNLNLNLTIEGVPYGYDSTSHKLSIIDNQTGKITETYNVAKEWFNALVNSDGSIYYVKDNYIKAIKVGFREDDIKAMLKEDENKASIPGYSKIEQDDDWLIIGGVRIPKNAR